MSSVISMAAFALAASISPGPVNLVALGAGARYGLRPSMAHVTGATVGFTLLLLLTGLGLHELLLRVPAVTAAIRWAGIVFLLYMAWKLAADDGELGERDGATRPTFLSGATLQWLNPKAWLAAVAGMGAYAAGGETAQVWRFTAIYFAICYVSIACWAYAGAFLRPYLRQPARVRLLNRAMAALLVLSAGYLLLA